MQAADPAAKICPASTLQLQVPVDFVKMRKESGGPSIVEVQHCYSRDKCASVVGLCHGALRRGAIAAASPVRLRRAAYLKPEWYKCVAPHLGVN